MTAIRRAVVAVAAAPVLAVALMLAVPGIAGAECVALSDFAKDAPGSFRRAGACSATRRARCTASSRRAGCSFCADGSRTAGHAAIEREWDLKEYPDLAWRWRPRTFPEGSDERNSRTNDSALGVYVGFPRAAMAVRSLKYVWSRVAPVGTEASAERRLHPHARAAQRCGPAREAGSRSACTSPRTTGSCSAATPGIPAASACSPTPTIRRAPPRATTPTSGSAGRERPRSASEPSRRRFPPSPAAAPTHLELRGRGRPEAACYDASTSHGEARLPAT